MKKKTTNLSKLVQSTATTGTSNWHAYYSRGCFGPKEVGVMSLSFEESLKTHNLMKAPPGNVGLCYLHEHHKF